MQWLVLALLVTAVGAQLAYSGYYVARVYDGFLIFATISGISGTQFTVTFTSSDTTDPVLPVSKVCAKLSPWIGSTTYPGSTNYDADQVCSTTTESITVTYFALGAPGGLVFDTLGWTYVEEIGGDVMQDLVVIAPSINPVFGTTESYSFVHTDSQCVLLFGDVTRYNDVSQPDILVYNVYPIGTATPSSLTIMLTTPTGTTMSLTGTTTTLTGSTISTCLDSSGDGTAFVCWSESISGSGIFTVNMPSGSTVNHRSTNLQQDTLNILCSNYILGTLSTATSCPTLTVAGATTPQPYTSTYGTSLRSTCDASPSTEGYYTCDIDGNWGPFSYRDSDSTGITCATTTTATTATTTTPTTTANTPTTTATTPTTTATPTTTPTTTTTATTTATLPHTAIYVTPGPGVCTNTSVQLLDKTNSTTLIVNIRPSCYGCTVCTSWAATTGIPRAYSPLRTFVVSGTSIVCVSFPLYPITNNVTLEITIPLGGITALLGAYVQSPMRNEVICDDFSSVNRANAAYPSPIPMPGAFVVVPGVFTSQYTGNSSLACASLNAAPLCQTNPGFVTVCGTTLPVINLVQYSAFFTAVPGSLVAAVTSNDPLAPPNTTYVLCSYTPPAIGNPLIAPVISSTDPAVLLTSSSVSSIHPLVTEPDVAFIFSFTAIVPENTLATFNIDYNCNMAIAGVRKNSLASIHSYDEYAVMHDGTGAVLAKNPTTPGVCTASITVADNGRGDLCTFAGFIDDPSKLYTIIVVSSPPPPDESLALFYSLLPTILFVCIAAWAIIHIGCVAHRMQEQDDQDMLINP